MIQTNSMLPPADLDNERRRALAKVYDILNRLADETEKQSAIPESASVTEEIPSEQNLVQLALL